MPPTPPIPAPTTPAPAPSTLNHLASVASPEEAHLSSTFADRLLTLSDGRPGLRGAIHVDIRAPGRDAVPSVPDHGATLDFISSDETLDRYGEIITAAGWNLDHYRRNPVFQNSHQYGDIIFTLGKALITEVRTVADRQVLFQRIEFAIQANPMARIAHGLYSGGFLHTVSVGFIPIHWEDGAKSSPPSPSSIPFRRRYLEQELLEVSAVAIPANPNALALGLKSGAVGKADLKEAADLINYALAQPGRAGSPSAHPLLPLARAIRDQLRNL